MSRAPKPQVAAAKRSELPPLPELRPKVVEPVAGDAGTEDIGPDPGLEDAGPRPTQPASAGAKPRRTGHTDITKATAMSNGIALPPLEAPEEVKQIIEAGNIIARSPYVWGGGHGKWLDTGYDCSGSVSFALAAAGLLEGPMASGPLMSWGEPGKGKWVTIYTHPGHVFMVVAGVRFDTSAAGHRLALGERDAHHERIRRPPSRRSLGGSQPHATSDRRADDVSEACPSWSRRPLMPRSHDRDDLLDGLPPEVLDEVAAAWERAQEPLPDGLELWFASEPALGRAWARAAARRRRADDRHQRLRGDRHRVR